MRKYKLIYILKNEKKEKEIEVKAKNNREAMAIGAKIIANISNSYILKEIK